MSQSLSNLLSSERLSLQKSKPIIPGESDKISNCTCVTRFKKRKIVLHVEKKEKKMS